MTRQNASRPKTDGHATGLAVPAHLATPTDETQQGVQAITEALNALVADAFASR